MPTTDSAWTLPVIKPVLVDLKMSITFCNCWNGTSSSVIVSSKVSTDIPVFLKQQAIVSSEVINFYKEVSIYVIVKIFILGNPWFLFFSNHIQTELLSYILMVYKFQRKSGTFFHLLWLQYGSTRLLSFHTSCFQIFDRWMGRAAIIKQDSFSLLHTKFLI